MPRFTAACVQVNARDDMTANLDAAHALARDARAAGADLIASYFAKEAVKLLGLSSSNLID